jgi:hypothetical protein
MTKPDTPFPRHWLYYIILKYGIIVVAVLVTLYTVYRLQSSIPARERLYLFDTTLRDGAQTNGVDFTPDDKLAIAKMLDDIGIDYVEAAIRERT